MSTPLAGARVVVIGVSTGGPAALAEVVPALPADLGVPVVVVCHMPEAFTGPLAARLDALGALRVVEAADGDELQAGTVHVAAGGRHLVPERRRERVLLRLDDGPAVNSCRPSVDVTLQHAVRVWGRGVLAVVLTGMGRDGLQGCREVAAAGGQVVVQDEETSVVWGMPGYVARAGLADRVAPLPAVASVVTARVRGALTATGGAA